MFLTDKNIPLVTRVAFLCLFVHWFSLLIYISKPPATMGSAIFGTIIVALPWLFMLIKIMRGSIVARYMFSALMILSILVTVFAGYQMYSQSGRVYFFSSIFNTLGTVLSYIGFVLLYFPSSRKWFKKKAE